MANPRHKDFPDWYRTRSLQVAAFLVAKGADLPRVSGQRGHADFWFNDPGGEWAWEAMKFDNDEPVGARTLFDAMRKLRTGMDEVFGPRQ
jgi:hypothetical protein